jgi:hypothetical protein
MYAEMIQEQRERELFNPPEDPKLGSNLRYMLFCQSVINNKSNLLKEAFEKRNYRRLEHLISGLGYDVSQIEYRYLGEEPFKNADVFGERLGRMSSESRRLSSDLVKALKNNPSLNTPPTPTS